jgi:hypothetical protein
MAQLDDIAGSFMRYLKEELRTSRGFSHPRLARTRPASACRTFHPVEGCRSAVGSEPGRSLIFDRPRHDNYFPSSCSARSSATFFSSHSRCPP